MRHSRTLMEFCIQTAQNLFHMLLLVRMIIQLGTLKLYCVEKNLKTFLSLHKSQQKRVLFCILNIEDPPFCARCSEHVCKLSFFIEQDVLTSQVLTFQLQHFIQAAWLHLVCVGECGFEIIILSSTSPPQTAQQWLGF